MDTAERIATPPTGAAPAWKLRVEDSMERAICEQKVGMTTSESRSSHLPDLRWSMVRFHPDEPSGS